MIEARGQAERPALPDTVAAAFAERMTGKRKVRISAVLGTLVATGAARARELDGTTRHFVPR